MYIYIYVYIYVCIHIYIHIYIYIRNTFLFDSERESNSFIHEAAKNVY